MKRVSGKITTAAALVVGLSCTNPAAAQSAFPERAVKIVIGFPAGTAPDVLARLLADRMQGSLGKPVIVEAAPGAAGNIAADRVAKAAPDGHTLLLAGNASIVINGSLYDKLPYDPQRDLAPISQLSIAPNVLVVSSELTATSPSELAAQAKALPDDLTYAHSGVGVSQHLGAEVFKQMAGIKLRAVAYTGSNGILPDVLTSRVSMCFCGMATSLPHIKDGKLRALAVTSLQRAAALPDVPTMDEAGFKGFDVTAWFGLLAPAGTSASIVEKLNREVRNALKADNVLKSLEANGMIPVGNSPAEFQTVIQTETPYWRRLIAELNLKAK